MSLRQVQVCLLALLLSSLTASAAARAPTLRDILGSQLLVKEYLDTLDVPYGRIRHLTQEALVRDFPEYLFFVVAYPPTAKLPEPLKTVNVFAVGPDGRVRLLSGSPEIVELFKVGFRPEKGEGRCREAVRVTLLLLGARYPDYQFPASVEEIKILGDMADRRRGVGKLVVKEGGTGFIEVTVTLDRNCDPVEVVETVTLKPARPGVVALTRVQIETAEKVVKRELVTLKLSTDSVRYIEDPVLLRVLPGQLLFVVPAYDPEKDVSGKFDVMVVGPEGKPERLLGGGRFLSWFNTAFGPVTDDPHVKEGLGVAVRVTEAIHPEYKFGPPGDPQLVIDDRGERTVSSKTVAVGPGGKNRVLEIRLHFGKRGRLVSWGIWFRPEKT